MWVASIQLCLHPNIPSNGPTWYSSCVNLFHYCWEDSCTRTLLIILGAFLYLGICFGVTTGLYLATGKSWQDYIDNAAFNLTWATIAIPMVLVCTIYIIVQQCKWCRAERRHHVELMQWLADNASRV